MYEVAALALVVVLFPYVVGPLLIYAKQRFRIPAEIVRIDPQEQPLPVSIRGHFAESYDALVKLGFELVGVIGLPKLVANVQSICAFYTNRRTHVVANT